MRILIGDVFDRLRELPEESVHCAVTSPPYWGLRDYGTATWEGGDPTCDHRSPTMREDRNEERATLAGSVATNRDQLLLAHRSTCGKCGAVKVDRQLGLEPSLGEHLEVMVAVFREVRRVLRKDGTLWLNYGDCYATAPNGRSAADTKAAGKDDRTFRDRPFSTVGPVFDPGYRKRTKGGLHGERRADPEGRVVSGGYLKPKDLCMVPNRLAIALQEDGWWVRSEIVWGKPNGMPDSSGHFRPATAHEKIFLLSKTGAMHYDAAAVRMPPAAATVERLGQDLDCQSGSQRANGGSRADRPMKAVGRAKRSDKQRGHSRRHAGFNDRWDRMTREEQQANGRLLRNYEPDLSPVVTPEVWHIATAAFSEAHFATFPPALVEPCIKAGCPEGGTVLDPFGGAGTTGLVADRLGRDAILIELNPEYAEIARRRIAGDAPMFAGVEVVA